MAGARGIRGGKTKNPPFSGILIFGRGEFQAGKAHQLRVTDLPGARGGWGFSC